MSLRMHIGKIFLGLCLLLHPAVAIAQGGNHILQTVTSPDLTRIVQLADFNVAFKYELFSTNLLTLHRMKIGKPTASMEDVLPGFLISSDSKLVVYSQQNTALGSDRKLYSTRIDRQENKLISQPMQTNGGVERLQPVWDGMSVRYLADPVWDEQYHWYRVSMNGGKIVEEIFIDGFEHGDTEAWQ